MFALWKVFWKLESWGKRMLHLTQNWAAQTSCLSARYKSYNWIFLECFTWLNFVECYSPVFGYICSKHPKDFPVFSLLLSCFLFITLQVGGLGDVVTSLSRAVQDLNHNVDIIFPKYDCLNFSHVSLIAVTLAWFIILIVFTRDIVSMSLNYGLYWF